MSESILVTGGAGYIGSHTCVELLRAGYDVAILDNLSNSRQSVLRRIEKISGRKIEFFEGDILDRSLVDSLLAEADVVVHFAAESHVDRSILGAADFVMTNVVGTQTLLDSALHHGIEHFVHVSTDEVYGSIERGSWDEERPLEPNSPYSASKAASDLLARSYFRTHQLPVSITRCSNNYGPYQFPEKVIPLFVTNLMDGHNVPLYGEGANIRDWLHVDDHCRAIHMVQQKGRPGEVYNIGGGTELTNRELTEQLLQACGATWESVVNVEDRKGHDLRYSVDIGKVQRELGYEPRIDCARGLADTVKWYTDNRQWWEPLKERARLAR